VETGAAVTASDTASVGSAVGPATATCPAGKFLVGGGAKVTNTTTGGVQAGAIEQSYPSTPGDGGTWTAVAVVIVPTTTSGDHITVQAFADCA
jgi:hypothetical protein